jgi:hypothetical protein
MNPPTETPAKVRPATLEDAVAIRRINRENGMDMDAALWRARWETYPFEDEFHNIPIGWVLESSAGEVVGSLGSVHMLYELEGRRIKALIATAWGVSPAHRSQALKMMTAFYRQKGVDLWLNGSANVITSQILTGFKIPRMPVPDYATPCFWATRPHAFARAALMRRSTPGAAALAYPAGLALYIRDVFSRSGRGTIASPVRRLQRFDGRFDTLWEKIRTGPARLRAIRTQAVLEWRFDGEPAVILATENKGELSGYAILMRRSQDMGMDMYDVADLQAVGDDPVVTRDLLLGSIEFARKEGAAALKFMTGTPAKRRPAAALRPYTYMLPLWQLYARTAPELSAKLSSADAWDFSLFDTY